MTNRRRHRRGAWSLKGPEKHEAVAQAPALPSGVQAVATDLTHKGRPVVWLDGILYCDGQPIGRRPQP